MESHDHLSKKLDQDSEWVMDQLITQLSYSALAEESIIPRWIQF